jgi:hypothetical protein
MKKSDIENMQPSDSDNYKKLSNGARTRHLPNKNFTTCPRNITIYVDWLSGMDVEEIAQKENMKPVSVRTRISSMSARMSKPDIDAMRNSLATLYNKAFKAAGELLEAGDSRTVNMYLKGMGIYVPTQRIDKRVMNVNISAVQNDLNIGEQFGSEVKECSKESPKSTEGNKNDVGGDVLSMPEVPTLAGRATRNRGIHRKENLRQPN